jgi:hypothetical protein
LTFSDTGAAYRQSIVLRQRRMTVQNASRHFPEHRDPGGVDLVSARWPVVVETVVDGTC